MCGRYEFEMRPSDIADVLKITSRSDFLPCTNIAPSEQVPVVFKEGSNIILDTVKWGYTPGWSNGPKFLINLKAESVTEKSFAKNALMNGRCILPATGFFEWKTTAEGQKIPVLFRIPSESFFGIAGLLFKTKLDSHECVLLTTSANQTVSSVHSRMPVIIPKERWHKWIEIPDPTDALAKYAHPFVENKMEAWRVDPQFNNARYKGEIKLIEPVP